MSKKLEKMCAEVKELLETAIVIDEKNIRCSCGRKIKLMAMHGKSTSH